MVTSGDAQGMFLAALWLLAERPPHSGHDAGRDFLCLPGCQETFRRDLVRDAGAAATAPHEHGSGALIAGLTSA
jgi:hypothetical protein